MKRGSGGELKDASADFLSRFCPFSCVCERLLADSRARTRPGGDADRVVDHVSYQTPSNPRAARQVTAFSGAPRPFWGNRVFLSCRFLYQGRRCPFLSLNTSTQGRRPSWRPQTHVNVLIIEAGPSAPTVPLQGAGPERPTGSALISTQRTSDLGRRRLATADCSPPPSADLQAAICLSWKHSRLKVKLIPESHLPKMSPSLDFCSLSSCFEVISQTAPQSRKQEVETGSGLIEVLR